MNSKRNYAILIGVIFIVAYTGLVLLAGTIAVASNFIDLNIMTFLPFSKKSQEYSEADTEVWRICDTTGVDDATGALLGSCQIFFYASELDTLTDHNMPLEDIDGFAPTPREVAIELISLLILERNGPPPDSHSLSLEIRDFAGRIEHTVSVSDIDLLTAPIKEWIPVKISSSQENLIISSSEYLAIRSNISGPSDETEMWWQVFPAFEVVVRDMDN